VLPARPRYFLESVTGIEAGNLEVRFQVVVRETNGQLVAASCLRPASNSGRFARARERAVAISMLGNSPKGSRLVRQFKVENANRGIKIGADAPPELVSACLANTLLV